MKRAVLGLWLLCASAIVHAAEWVRVSTIDVNQHWYDRSKIFVNADVVTYWRRVTFRMPQPSKAGLAASALYRERVDCRTHLHTTLGYLLYSKEQAVLDNVHTPDANPEPIIPETVGDQFEKLMCSLAPQLALEQRSPSGVMPRTPSELRDEIEFLEARLRLLREQLELQTKGAASHDSSKTQVPKAGREAPSEGKPE
jgi:hypothetical protein